MRALRTQHTHGGVNYQTGLQRKPRESSLSCPQPVGLSRITHLRISPNPSSTQLGEETSGKERKSVQTVISQDVRERIHVPIIATAASASGITPQ
jgi:hypothetical protein